MPDGATGPTGVSGNSIINAGLSGGNLIITIQTFDSSPPGLTYNIDVGYVVGSTGVTGPQGPTGATGAAGAVGQTGAYVTNAAVVGGNLIITLSTGITFSAGSVVGPAGATGSTACIGGSAGCVPCCNPLQGIGGTSFSCDNLIQIDRLVLSDTFHTWYDRTNQIIDAINPLNLYEIAGLTGIELVTGKGNCNYNGVVGISFKHGPGITWGNPDSVLGNSDFYKKMFVDPGTLPIQDGLFSVANDDLFIFKDISDTATVYSGTPKSVRAEYMVPPRLTFDTLELNGDVLINGNFTILGDQSSVGTNDIVVESKNINLAFQRSGLITITGPSASILQLYQFEIVGASAFYDTTGNNPGLTAPTIGVVKSITGPANGLTAHVSIGSIFQSGKPEDFQTGGFVKFKSATGATFSVLSADGATTNFFGDADLDGAGLIVKGASGDKYFTWENCSKAWISDKNLGVDTNLGFITARNYRNVCLIGDGLNEFNFYGTDGQTGHSTLRVGHDNAGRWAWSYAHNLPGSPLLLKYDSTTGTQETTLSTIYGLTQGPNNFISGLGGTAYMWAKGFNADYLDGAGATTGSPYGGAYEPNDGNKGSTAYTIPISDSRGRINANWLDADSTRIRVYQTSHGLTAGNCITRQVETAMGSTAANYILASPFSTDLSEAIGIVVEVINDDEFVYVNSGLATIPVPGDVKPGISLLLGASGGLTSDFGNLAEGSFYIEKSMFMPVSITGSASERFATGVVLSQPGFLVGGSASDQIYARGLVPVGTINPYSGSLNELSNSWLVCDGKKIRPGNYPELYKIIGLTGGISPLQRYYADLKFISSSSEAFIDEDSTVSGAGDGVASFYIKGGTRGLSEASGNRVTEQGDLVNITIYSNITKSVVASRDARVWVVGGDYQISLALRKADQDGYTRDGFVQELDDVKNSKDYSIRLYGRHRTDALSVWGTTLLPDFRNRTVYGAGAGSSQYDNGHQMVVGDVINNQTYQIENGIVRPYGDGVDGLSGTTGASGSYVYTPGVVTNFIIRSTPEVNALILTGHNHDDRYVRIDMTAQAQLHTDSGMTAQKRANVRYNIQALSRETGDVHSGPAGITFQSEGQYKFRASSSSSNAANIEIENEYGWSKIKLGGASGSVIDIASPFDNTATGITSENYDIRFISDNSKAQIIAGAGLPLFLSVGGITGSERNWGISITGTTGLSAGSVGIRTSNPVMTLDVRGSGIKVGPSIYEGNTTTPAGNWNTRPLEGMFYGGMFNSTGLTTIAVGLSMGSNLFPENPNGMYTVDPGSGITILEGNTIEIQTGFTWKIL